MLKVHQDLKNRLSWVSIMEEIAEPQNPFIIESLIEKECARMQHQIIQRWIVKELLNLFRTQKPTSILPLFKNLDEISCRKHVEQFVEISMTRTFCHPIVFPIGAMYLQRLISSGGLKKANLTEFLFRFSVCVTLASKMYEDKYVGNNVYFSWFYTENDPFSLKSFSDLEFKICEVLGFDLNVSYIELKNFMQLCK